MPLDATAVAALFFRLVVAMFAAILFYAAVMGETPRPAFLTRLVTIAYYTIRLVALLFIET